MSERIAPIRAAIDIGSNTIHIVVARSLPDDLNIIADEQEVVRIGESVTATGAISPEKREEALTTLCRYRALAGQYTSEPVLVVATEAIRQATNNAEFLAAVKERAGLEAIIVDGDVEATLTFYGATYELLKEPGAPAQIGVMDLGGGSMELVTAQDMQITWRASSPLALAGCMIAIYRRIRRRVMTCTSPWSSSIPIYKGSMSGRVPPHSSSRGEALIPCCTWCGAPLAWKRICGA